MVIRGVSKDGVRGYTNVLFSQASSIFWIFGKDWDSNHGLSVVLSSFVALPERFLSHAYHLWLSSKYSFMEFGLVDCLQEFKPTESN